MSTFEQLNQRGVVIICIIIHCGNGFRESLVLKLCYKIRRVLFSAHLIEDQFEICITIYEVSTCLPLQSFPAVLCIARSTKQPSAVNNDSQHRTETLKDSMTAHITHIFSVLNMTCVIRFLMQSWECTSPTVGAGGFLWVYRPCVCVAGCQVESGNKAADIVLLASCNLPKPFSQPLTFSSSLSHTRLLFKHFSLFPLFFPLKLKWSSSLLSSSSFTLLFTGVLSV